MQNAIIPSNSTNANTSITYNLSNKSIIMSNSSEITEINKRMNNWKTVSPWITPTLLNGWTNYVGAGGWTPVSYYINEFGELELRGRIAGGTATDGTVVFILPVGFRPTLKYTVPTLSNDSYAFILITTDGEVKIYHSANTWISLDGVKIKL